MERFNFSDTIKAGVRSLYLQTYTDEDGSCIVSVLYEGGKIAGKRKKMCGRILTQDETAKAAETYHMTNMTGLKRLFSSPAAGDDTESRSDIQKRAELFLEWGMDEDAGLILKKGCDIYPKNEKIFRLAGVSHLRRKQFSKALACFARSLLLSNGSTENRIYILISLTGLLAFMDSTGCDAGKVADIEERVSAYLRDEKIIAYLGSDTCRQLQHCRNKGDFDSLSSEITAAVSKRLYI